MEKKILLFGFDSLLTILALEAATGAFGVELVPVARQDYNVPMGVLAGVDTASSPSQPYAGLSLGGRMMVLCGLEKELEALLPELRKAGAGADCLKAVLTEHNRKWSAVALFAELERERQAFAQKAGQS